MQRAIIFEKSSSVLIPDSLQFKQEKQSLEVRELNAKSSDVEFQCSVNTIPKEVIYSQWIILPFPFSLKLNASMSLIILILNNFEKTLICSPKIHK